MCSNKHGSKSQGSETQTENAPGTRPAQGDPAELVRRLEALFLKRVESGEAFDCSGCEQAHASNCSCR
jgi:hypothetical protein